MKEKLKVLILNYKMLQSDESNSYNEQDMSEYIENEMSMYDEYSCVDGENDPASTVRAEFSDGYSLRNLVEYLRLTNYHGTFKFTSDQITYDQMDGKESILNCVTIDTHELTDYNIQSSTGEVCMRVSLPEMRQRTKNIGKKDRAVISKLAYDNNMYLEVYSQNSASTGDRPNVYIINTIKAETKIYKRPEYNVERKKPNCAVYQGDFAKFCSSFISIKCNYVTAHGFETGILFRGMSPTHEIIGVKEFGKCDETQINNTIVNQESVDHTNIIKPGTKPPRLQIYEHVELESIKIPIDIIKGLAKLNNLSATGNIKMFFEYNKPLGLICSIGTYGDISVFLCEPKK